MNTRKINHDDNHYSESIETSIAIAKKMIIQIDFYLENESLSEENKEYLVKSKETINEILKKYDNFLNQFIMDKKYEEVAQDFETIFDIEDKIYQQITLTIWKNYFSNIRENFKQGDEFRYIVHAGREIINLPGKLGYKKSRNFDGDYISASILSNKDITMFEKNNVGLILEPNESIICAVATDAGTVIDGRQTERTVCDLGDGIYVNSGHTGFMVRNDENYTDIATKISHPALIEQETEQKNQKQVYGNTGYINEVVLDDKKAKVVGILFKTNGKEINFLDYVHVKKLEALYKVPVRIINTSIYRKQKGQPMFTEEENENFVKQLEKFSHPKNLKLVKKHPSWTRKLIHHYFTEVVEGAEFDEETKLKIDEVFAKIVEQTYYTENEEKVWNIVETTEPNIIKSEQCVSRNTTLKIVLKKENGKYCIEQYINGIRMQKDDDDGFNQENIEVVYNLYKQQLQKFINNRETRIDYSDFTR
ncbi:MAG: hypothetical protein IKF38_06670 [Clostridia bacterium]|nr:hypothetical protein [Clostridia bacterium]